MPISNQDIALKMHSSISTCFHVLLYLVDLSSFLISLPYCHSLQINTRRPAQRIAESVDDIELWAALKDWQQKKARELDGVFKGVSDSGLLP